MYYKAPKQQRAIASEREFLAALDGLLQSQSFEATTIEQVAEAAGLTRSAFLRRFGSKEQALFRLFTIYADAASDLMHQCVCDLEHHDSLHRLLTEMCASFDALLRTHFSANRGMNEYFKKDLESHDMTKKIFSECVVMMKKIQSKFAPPTASELGAYAAAQLLVSLNFHYVMRAMPALPLDDYQRHTLNAELIALALKK